MPRQCSDQALYLVKGTPSTKVAHKIRRSFWEGGAPVLPLVQDYCCKSLLRHGLSQGSSAAGIDAL